MTEEGFAFAPARSSRPPPATDIIARGAGAHAGIRGPEDFPKISCRGPRATSVYGVRVGRAFAPSVIPRPQGRRQATARRRPPAGLSPRRQSRPFPVIIRRPDARLNPLELSATTDDIVAAVVSHVNSAFIPIPKLFPFLLFRAILPR